MAMVDPQRLFLLLARARADNSWVPALRVLDVSQLLPLSHPAAAANALPPRAPLDLAAFPAALAALEVCHVSHVSCAMGGWCLW